MSSFSRKRQLQLSILFFVMLVLGYGLYTFKPAAASMTAPFRAWASRDIVRVEMEGLVLGDPFDAPLSKTDILPWISAALIKRYEAIGAPVSLPHCPLDVARYTTITFVPPLVHDTKQRVSVAINLRNSQDILPSLSLALLTTVYHLERSNRVYISIFESDSTDRTRPMLSELAAALVALNVHGLTIRSPLALSSTFPKADRIVVLATLRNEALSPLLPTAADGTVLFVNDVVTCGSDLLELVHQLRLQNAHAVMGTDWWVRDDEPPQALFRDIWVARGINGELPYKVSRDSGYSTEAPTGNWVRDAFLTQDEDVQARWLNGRPFPVYSGWNGAIAFSASLFTQRHVRFRASGKAGWKGGDIAGSLGKWGQLVANPGYIDADCAGSECSLVARDIWNLLEGRARFALAPQARTAYSLQDWWKVDATVPPVRRTGYDGANDELVDWANVTMPASVVCVPYILTNGSRVSLLCLLT